MKAIVFDTSTIISIVTNDLLWTLPLLKDKFKGNFYISDDVKEEIIDDPLNGKKYKLEAMQILSLLAKGVIEIYDNNEVHQKAVKITELANNIFIARDNYIKVASLAEMEALALADYLNAVYAVDERNARVLVENPEKLALLFGKRLNTKVKVNKKNLKLFKEEVSKVNVIRSTELMLVAYELGLLDKYLNPDEKKIANINLKQSLLDGLLWGLKLRGCAISQDEIYQLLKLKGY